MDSEDSPLYLLLLLTCACVGVYTGPSSFALRFVQLGLFDVITWGLMILFPDLERLVMEAELRAIFFLHRDQSPRSLTVDLLDCLLLLLPCVSLGFEFYARFWIDVVAALYLVLRFNTSRFGQVIPGIPLFILHCCAMGFIIYVWPALSKLCQGIASLLEKVTDSVGQEYERRHSEYAQKTLVVLVILRVLVCLLVAWTFPGFALLSAVWCVSWIVILLVLNATIVPDNMMAFFALPIWIHFMCALLYGAYVEPALFQLCQGVASFAETTDLANLLDKVTDPAEKEYDRRHSEFAQETLVVLVILRVLVCLLVAWTFPGFALLSAVWCVSWIVILFVLWGIKAPKNVGVFFSLPLWIPFMCGLLFCTYIEPSLFQLYQGVPSFAKETLLKSTKLLRELNCFLEPEYDRQQEELVQVPFVALLALRALVCLSVVWILLGSGFVSVFWFAVAAALFLLVRSIDENVAALPQTILLLCAGKSILFVKSTLSRWLPAIQIFAQETMWSLARNLKCFFMRKYVRQPEKEQELRDSCARGDLATVRSLVEEAYVNLDASSDGRTPLLLATQNGHSEVVEFLLEQRAEVNVKNRKGLTALMLAAQGGHERTVELLISKGADMNATDSEENTPLLLACRNGHIDVMEFLLEQGALVNEKNGQGSTALTLAARVGQQRIIELLISKGANVNATDSEKNTPVLLASQNGHFVVVEFLLEQGAEVKNKQGSTALMLAAQAGRQSVIRLLESKGADVNAKDNKTKRTPLMEAALRGDLATVQLLLQLGADPSMTDGDNLKAHHLAFQENHRHVGDAILCCIPQSDRGTVIPRLAQQIGIPVIPATEIEFGDFELDKNVGGDFAGVWLDSQVAITLFGSTSGITLPFEEQAKSWLGLRHPNIQKLYGAVNEGYYLFACEHMTGGSLSAFVKRPLDEWRKGDVEYAFKCLYDSALGLRFLHERGIVHGAVRLENILISADKTAKLANMKWATDKGKLVDIHALAECIKEVCGRVKKLKNYVPIISKYAKLAGDVRSSSCTISFVVHSLESIDWSQPSASVNTTDTTQSDTDRKASDFDDMLEELHRLAKESKNELYIELCDYLQKMWRRLLSEKASISVQVYEDVTQVLGKLQSAMDNQMFRSHVIQRMSSSLAADVSLDLFRRQMEKLMFLLEAPKKEYEEFEKCMEQLRGSMAEVFVSVGDEKLTLLDSTAEDDVLQFLRNELQSEKYTDDKYDFIKKVCESGQLSSSLEPLPKWFIGPHELENENVFAWGGFGEVSRAKWLNSDVVVKRLLMTDDRGEVRERFQDEMSVWFDLNHPHVVKLFGGCHIGPPFFVCEWAENGRLDAYVKEHSGELWQKLYQAALGLEYLHVRNIRHGDLKCDNILISGDGRAQLTDFGLSSSESVVQKEVTAATRWKAPECFETEKTTCESDIFSLGMCIIQAVTGNAPWGEAKDSSVKRNVKMGELPPRPEQMTDSQWQLVTDMCKFEPSERLNILVVVQWLKKLAENSNSDLIGQGGIAVVTESESHARRESNARLLKLMLTMLSNATKKKKMDSAADAGYQVYGLLAERLRDIITSHNDVKFESRLNSIVVVVCEWFEQQQDQQPDQEQTTVDQLKTIFRGFSLHRQIDRLLAQYFIETSNEAHRWTEKWSEYIQPRAL